MDRYAKEFGVRVAGAEYKNRPAAYALITNENHELAVIRVGDRFFLPGGGIEGEESREQCLARECSEELGYNIEIGEYLGCLSQWLISFKTNEPLRIIGHIYSARLLEPNFCKTEPDHELIWLNPVTAASRMLVEFQAWAILQKCA